MICPLQELAPTLALVSSTRKYLRTNSASISQRHNESQLLGFLYDPMPILSSNPRVLVNILEILLRQCYISPACGRHAQIRHYATKLRSSEATDIAVLGGGITGLASAYYLSKLLPNAKITLFEASTRLGGWLHSKQVDVGNGKVVFEQGPRNLRPTNPNGLVTLDLVGNCIRMTSLLLTNRLRSMTWAWKTAFL